MRDQDGPGGRAASKDQAASADAQLIIAESRWPMATAVTLAVVLQICKPDWMLLGPKWIAPTVWSVLLIALILSDPGRIDDRSRRLRILTISLVILVAAEALGSTVLLILELVQGGPHTGSATSLLAAGGIVWADNIIACSLLYWALDSGGSAARAQRVSQYPDLAFPQMLTPGLAPPGWRPRYIDYLYLGFTATTALSPADVMPLARWAKLLMMIQALVSLTIMVLVVGRAVNVLA